MDEHPVTDIKSIISTELEGKCILLGVTGSVAIYRAVDVARGLIKRGADVHVMMTSEAQKLVCSSLFEWATGNDVISELSGKTEHILYARKCDAMIVLPATLNTLSKIAYGITDENVTLTALSFLGYKKKVLLVPAMHYNMYISEQTVDIMSRLENIDNVFVLKPRKIDSSLKIHETNDIIRWIVPIVLRGQDLKGYNILVTAGATREYIDRVRFITNPGTGRMGIELAAEAAARGAEVTLLIGHVETEIPGFIYNVEKVETTEEMAEKIELLTKEKSFDIILSAASPVDFKPSKFFDEKIKSGQTLTIEFNPTPKVIGRIVSRPKILVAFVADVVEDLEQLKDMAFSKLKKHNAEMAVANNVGRKDIGFGSMFNEVLIAFKDGRYELSPKMRKEEIARFILDKVKLIL